MCVQTVQCMIVHIINYVKKKKTIVTWFHELNLLKWKCLLVDYSQTHMCSFFFLIFDIFVKKEKKKWLMKVFGPLKFSFVAHART